MGIRLSIPSDYEDITVGQYRDYYAAKNDLERLMAICEIDRKTAQEIPINHIPTLLDVFVEGLSKQSQKFSPTITLGKTTYGFIPNLYNMTLAEYADAVELCKDLQKNIVLLAGLFYRPVTKQVGDKYQITKYDPADNELREDEIKQMTLQHFNGMMLFFWTLSNELQKTSADYLSQEIHQMKQMATEMGLIQKD